MLNHLKDWIKIFTYTFSVNRRPLITAAIYNAHLISDIPKGSAAVFID
jgi:hypothetical protein